MKASNHLLLAAEAALKAGEAILEVYETEFSVERKEDRSPLTLADKRAHEIIESALSVTSIPVLSEEGKTIPYEERKGWEQLWIVDPLDGTKEFVRKNGEFTVNIALVEQGITRCGVVYQPVTDTLYAGSEEGSYRLFNASQVMGGPDFSFFSDAEKLPCLELPQHYTIVASRSHLSPETADFISEAQKEMGELRYISAGSSLKLCMIAEGRAHVYPRFAPTMEWDTAAGHAVVKGAGKNVLSHATQSELRYNKPDLHNDWFIAR